MESQDEEVLDFKENFSSLQQEIDYKTRKLRKMYARWQSVRQEMGDLGDELETGADNVEQVVFCHACNLMHVNQLLVAFEEPQQLVVFA